MLLLRFSLETIPAYFNMAKCLETVGNDDPAIF